MPSPLQLVLLSVLLVGYSAGEFGGEPVPVPMPTTVPELEDRSEPVTCVATPKSASLTVPALVTRTLAPCGCKGSEGRR